MRQKFNFESKSALDKIKGFAYGVSKIVAPDPTEDVIVIKSFSL